MSDALSDLLDDELEFDPVTVAGFTNHLPMTLVALERLGADEGQLADQVERYRANLVPASPEYSEARRRFADAIASNGVDAVLAEHVPRLVPGLGSFHSPIRLAYAVEAGHVTQIAAALAYWQMSYVELGPPAGSAPDTVDPLVLLEAMRVEARLGGRRLTGPSIVHTMVEAAQTPGFAEIASRLAIDPDTFDRLAQAALALYAAGDDFTALHVVTFVHAMRVLRPWLGDPELAAGHAFVVAASGYVSIATPAVADADELARQRSGTGAGPAWDKIAAAAVASTDEHVVKLVHTCREEQGFRGEPVYQALAARKAGL